MQTLFAGTIFGLLSLSNTVGKLILGAIFDKFRTTGGILFVGSCMTIAMVSLLLANAKSFAFVFAIAYGFSMLSFPVLSMILHKVTKWHGSYF